MRIAFAGTPDFAAAALAALIEAAPLHGWTIPLVLSQPDRPAGRGMRLTPSPVKALALEHRLTVDTPLTLSVKKGAEQAQAAHQRLRDAAPDVLVVAAYGLILPTAVLEIPQGLPAQHRDHPGEPVRAINIHASLLPRWRGAAPVARAIEAGDAETGITLMQMDAGLDTGPMLQTAVLPIPPTATTGSLTAQLAQLGAELLVQALAQGSFMPTPQPADGVTYAHKLDKAESLLNWQRPAQVLACQVRAFDPFPVAAMQYGDQLLRVRRAQALPGTTSAAPGTVLAAQAEGLDVATSDGVLRITELQRAGAKRLAVREFLAGLPIKVGTQLTLPAAHA